jgi:hypothetical protein
VPCQQSPIEAAIAKAALSLPSLRNSAHLAKYRTAGNADASGLRLRLPNRGSAPEFHATVLGHDEVNGHTLYAVQCQLRCDYFKVTWLANRRLKQLQKDLHVPLKQRLGPGLYYKYFSATPFARRGGVPGTTSRLKDWFASLSACINSGRCLPRDIELVLEFLDTPDSASAVVEVFDELPVTPGSSPSKRNWHSPV